MLSQKNSTGSRRIQIPISALSSNSLIRSSPRVVHSCLRTTRQRLSAPVRSIEEKEKRVTKRFHRPCKRRLKCNRIARWNAVIIITFAVSHERSNSQYADVNGLQLYYEVHGEGAPIALLHGGVSASEVFGRILPKLAKTRKVLAVHLQGHGHTKDIDRPLRFEFMADDVAALLAYLKISKADLLGYSLGGGAAPQTTIRHPALVNRLVVMSAAMKHDGSFPEVNAAFDQMNAHALQIAANIKGSPLGQMYPEVHWESLLRKIAEMESHGFD
jgi:hypothetical protein